MPQGSHFLKLSDFIDFINGVPYQNETRSEKLLKLLKLLRTIIKFAKQQWENISIVYVSINAEKIKPTPDKILGVNGVSTTIEYPYEYTITENLHSDKYLFKKSEDNIPIVPKTSDIIKTIIQHLKNIYNDNKTNNNYNNIYIHITSPTNANGIIREGFDLNKANTGIDQELPEKPSKKRPLDPDLDPKQKKPKRGGTKRRNKRKRKTLKKKSRKTRRK